LEKAQREKDEQDRKVLDETTKYENEAEKLSKEIAGLELAIANLRTQREDMNREVLESSKKVELAKIDRRNAELEIQRMYDIVAQKVAASFLTQAPPLPAK
jgi:septal ring factor EnvC (AmiA/AmiB activator)